MGLIDHGHCEVRPVGVGPWQIPPRTPWAFSRMRGTGRDWASSCAFATARLRRGLGGPGAFFGAHPSQ